MHYMAVIVPLPITAPCLWLPALKYASHHNRRYPSDAQCTVSLCRVMTHVFNPNIVGISVQRVADVVATVVVSQ